MGKRRRKICCDIFDDTSLPPCAEFLGNINPIIKDGEIIYRNNNRLYFFLSFDISTNKNSNIEYDPADPSTFMSNSIGHIQISSYNFFIGIFINEIQKGNIKYDTLKKIHDDCNADKFIKEILNNDYKIENSFTPSLSYAISNSNAILPFYYSNYVISPINYYIVLILSRFYGEYGLLFGNNSYITNDYINYVLSNVYTGYSNY